MSLFRKISVLNLRIDKVLFKPKWYRKKTITDYRFRKGVAE